MSVEAASVDVLILGAGAAGLMCAMEAGKRGRSVLVIDHARKPAEKIRISGGGRCNFTNLHTSPDNFLSRNPRFAISALSRYTPQDFTALVERHRIRYHEKTLGQLFCDGSSQQIIDMLLDECRLPNITIRTQTSLVSAERISNGFVFSTSIGQVRAQSFVVASGGLSIPKMGATDIGYRLARQFGLSIVPTSPALVPLTFSDTDRARWPDLAGVAVPSSVSTGKQAFREAALFTHKGLSGPAILQISSYWRPEQEVRINLMPTENIATKLKIEKAAQPQRELPTVLAQYVPKRLAQALAEQFLNGSGVKRIGSLPDKLLDRIGSAVNDWRWVPAGTEGYRIAEVTQGGVDTAELSSQTMEAKKVPNLFFIGEVVDVTVHLGDYNFQWAWASGFVAGQVV